MHHRSTYHGKTAFARQTSLDTIPVCGLMSAAKDRHVMRCCLNTTGYSLMVFHSALLFSGGVHLVRVKKKCFSPRLFSHIH